METADLMMRIDDLLQQASWCERVPEMLAAGDPEIIDYVKHEGVPQGEPVELLSQAIALLIAERKRYMLRVLEKGLICQPN